MPNTECAPSADAVMTVAGKGIMVGAGDGAVVGIMVGAGDGAVVWQFAGRVVVNGSEKAGWVGWQVSQVFSFGS